MADRVLLLLRCGPPGRRRSRSPSGGRGARSPDSRQRSLTPVRGRSPVTRAPPRAAEPSRSRSRSPLRRGGDQEMEEARSERSASP